MQLNSGLLRNSILFVIISLPFCVPAYAAKAGIVVEFQNKDIYKECVEASGNTDGHDLLEKTNLDILWSPESAFGQLICRINGEGTDVQGNFCEFFGKFWNFNIASNSEWLHSPVGHNGLGGCWNRDENSFIGHYCLRDGDVLGYEFTESGEPPFITFDDICNTKTRLAIYSMKAFVDGKRKFGLDKDRKIEANPGSNIKLEVEIANKYSQIDGTEIEGIAAEGEFDSSSKIADSSREFDLEANEKKKVTLNFKIPENQAEDIYNLNIDVEGSDKSKNNYHDDVDIDVDVKRQSHKLVFNDLSLAASSSACNSNALLNIEISNLGDKDESGIFQIKNADLNIDLSTPFTIQVDKSFKKSYELQIGNVDSGTYPLEALATYNSGQDIEKKAANLVVKCENKKEIKKSTAIEMSKIPSSSRKIEAVKDAEATLENNEPVEYKTPAAALIIFGVEILAIISGLVFLAYFFRR